MTRKKDVDAFEFRQRVSMSSQIARKDERYSRYAGATPEKALLMGRIDVLQDYGLVPKSLVPFVEFYREYLDIQRISNFSSSSSEFTQLGFLVGDPTRYVSGKRKVKK